MSWQPIDTAPRDGSILGFSPEHGPLVYVARLYAQTGVIWEAQFDDDSWAGQPTHWQPLPPPPEGV